VEQFEIATCGPKSILHTKIGVGTADGTVGNLCAVVLGRPFFISLNFYESLLVANLCSVFNSIVFNKFLRAV
jgi:hypothetical protein